MSQKCQIGQMGQISQMGQMSQISQMGQMSQMSQISQMSQKSQLDYSPLTLPERRSVGWAFTIKTLPASQTGTSVQQDTARNRYRW
jgi:hypothetical protein